MPEQTTVDNVEWELAELVDAIAASIDEAEDTLSLKSYARGMAFALKNLQLDVAVGMRRAADGRVLFRTRENGQGGTVLKLDLSQMLESQLAGVRRPLEHDRPRGRDIDGLEGIGASDIGALAAVGVFSIDDLERYTQSAAMLAELSRKTGIAEDRLRLWRGLPFLLAATPASGAPGSRVVIDGGNLGSQAGQDALVVFEGQPATIEQWSPGRITVTMPDVTGAGTLFAVTGGQVSNAIGWEAVAPALVVDAMVTTPRRPLADEPFRLQAGLVNTGTAPVGPFEVRWQVADRPPIVLPHGVLLPGQRSAESSAELDVTLPPGTHTIGFTVDPDRRLALPDRAAAALEVEVTTVSRSRLSWGAAAPLGPLDPMGDAGADPLDVRRLVFRGLGRPDGSGLRAVPDLAQAWRALPSGERAGVSVTLREGLRFHDGMPVTADDVAFSYELALRDGSAWRERLLPYAPAVTPVDERTVAIAMELVDAVPSIDGNGLVLHGAAREIETLPIDTWPPGLPSLGRPPVDGPIDWPPTDPPPLPRRATLPPVVAAVPIVPRSAYSGDPAPIGAGPFAVAEAKPGGRLLLRRHPAYHLGVPRLDEIAIEGSRAEGDLVERLVAGELDGALLTDGKEHRERLEQDGRWRIAATAAGLDVQSAALLERSVADADPTWNAHLWYLARDAG